MRLVYVVNSLGAGGAERYLLELARDMVRRGHLVWVLALKKAIKGGAKDLEADFLGAGTRVMYLKSTGFSDLGMWFGLAFLLRRLRPDILHSHLPRSDVAAALVKWVVPGMVWISTIHDAYVKSSYSGHWIVPIFRQLWRRADHFIAVSKHTRDWGLANLGFPQQNVTVIYHGISMGILPEASSRPRGGPPQIGCLARFEKRKGQDTLIRAMVDVRKVLPDARLQLAGSDPNGFSAGLKELARSLSVEDGVDFLGFCATPLEFLRDLDVFVFASTAEGFGIVLLEAMAMKRPVVSSNIYPINHIIQDGESGLLVDPDDPRAFAAAIIALLEDSSRRYVMGEAAHDRCINEFSIEKMLNKTHELYLSLLGMRATKTVSNQA